MAIVKLATLIAATVLLWPLGAMADAQSEWMTHGRYMLPADADSPSTIHGNTLSGQNSSNRLCSGYQQGHGTPVFWPIEHPEDVKPPDPETGMWHVLTDFGGWQPIPAEALTTKTYPFGFIVYIKEQRGTVHVGCFNPPPGS